MKTYVMCSVLINVNNITFGILKVTRRNADIDLHLTFCNLNIASYSKYTCRRTRTANMHIQRDPHIELNLTSSSNICIKIRGLR